MPLRKSQLIIIAVVFLLIILVVLIVLGVLPGLRQNSEIQPIKLQFWGVNDEKNVFQEVFAAYRESHPQVQIEYRQFPEESYEQELINALAAGQQVDIAMIRNSWLPKHFDKLTPLASADAFANFEQIYPTVAIQDFAPDRIVYALPLYIDTLAMFYNSDIFDSKNIALVPKNWLEFENIAAALKKPIAIGGTEKSIPYATDILQALFLQSGVPMIDASFSRAVLSPQGANALSFYVKFADPRSPVYSWSDKFPNALETFVRGETAIIFAYQNQIREIQEKNPALPFKIAPFPQPSASTRNITWARYYGLAVPRVSPYQREAWEFISFLTSQTVPSEKYLNASGRPPALRSLIDKKINEPNAGVFIKQILSARSYPQADDNRVRAILSRMIESVITGRLASFSAVAEAETELTRLIQLRKR